MSNFNNRTYRMREDLQGCEIEILFSTGLRERAIVPTIRQVHIINGMFNMYYPKDLGEVERIIVISKPNTFGDDIEDVKFD